MNTRILLLFACLLTSHFVLADSLVGGIVGISDGDTLILLDTSDTQHRIRLAGIDAPEKAMPFGQSSKEALSKLCFGKQAYIEIVDTDRYGRIVGIVSCNGVNANEHQVKTGHAWVYRKYSKGFRHLFALEDTARNERLGLWIDPSPTPPWEWRHKNR